MFTHTHRPKNSIALIRGLCLQWLLPQTKPFMSLPTFSFEISTSKMLVSILRDCRSQTNSCGVFTGTVKNTNKFHLFIYQSRIQPWHSAPHCTEERELRTQPSLMAFLPWKEAIIKVKWADAERKAFFVIINVVLNLTPQGRGTLSKWPWGPCHFYSMP